MRYTNNNEVIIPAYVALGVPSEDARDYANSNCWETMIEGKSDQELIRGVNLPLFFELALNRGVSSVHGTMGPDTGNPCTFATFDDLLAVWKFQTDHQIAQAIGYIGSGITCGTLEHSNHGKHAFNPFLSALILVCIERERDVTRCGARYTIWHLVGEGSANMINALAAIKRLVFEERSVTMDDLLAALVADWQSHEDLRQRMMTHAPKYANDDAADAS